MLPTAFEELAADDPRLEAINRWYPVVCGDSPCHCRQLMKGWICTRAHGHGGAHVAGGWVPGRIFAWWPNTENSASAGGGTRVAWYSAPGERWPFDTPPLGPVKPAPVGHATVPTAASALKSITSPRGDTLLERIDAWVVALPERSHPPSDAESEARHLLAEAAALLRHIARRIDRA